MLVRWEEQSELESIVTLYEREPAMPETLPPTLAMAYDGGFVVPEGMAARPYVIANFVASLDGVIAYDTPGAQGGGAISGGSKPDHLVMGLLRAVADAVVFGAGSLREDKGAIRTPGFIYPPFADEYAALRAQLGKAQPQPLCVVVSASGSIDLNDSVLRQPEQQTLLATTAAGAERLSVESLPPDMEVLALAATADGGVAPLALLETLGRDYGVRVALHEGGPRLLASFLAAGALDEVFLTLAPQLAGRSDESRRPALLEGHAFTPQTAPWSTLLSAKRAGSHLFLRYGLH